MPAHVIIVAAGRGKRFGGAKQFYLINGRPLLYYSIAQFEKNKDISSIIVVVPKQTVITVNKCIREWEMHKVRRVVAGGKRRQDSVYSGLQTIHARNGIVVIHDGARPYVPQRIISRGLRLCRRYKGVICGLPIGDTVKCVQKNHVKHTVPRAQLYTVQTPQFFDLAALRFAYNKASGNVPYTDDAALVEAAGIPIHVFKGDYDNIKVTHRQDIKRIFKLLQCKKS
jgi:2-C-methyl-D-erythritol 4-phosphate cytidylyltransferase